MGPIVGIRSESVRIALRMLTNERQERIVTPSVFPEDIKGIRSA